LPEAAVLTDIEGTTTDIAFVHSVLFPYARERMGKFVRDHASDAEVAAALGEIRALEGDADFSLDDIVARLLAWIAEDRKIKPLKTLQGLIWREGYESGALKSHVYADAVAGLRRWHESGIALYVYSSGSVAAQKLLFAHAPEGDLNLLFSGYFDTSVGAKLEPGSYRRIAAALARPAQSILFLSDHSGELQAASAAGLRVIGLDRSRAAEAPPQIENSVPVVSSFDWIDPEAPSGLRGGQPPRALPISSLM
jgi:enolase-phosphatase E1